MEPVHNATFGPGSIVFMDDHYFVRCTFNGCTLIFAGGDFAWMECKFEGALSFNFAGAADRTLRFLASFGMAPAQQPVPPQSIPPTSKGERTH